jgi:hypothetical protein
LIVFFKELSLRKKITNIRVPKNVNARITENPKFAKINSPKALSSVIVLSLLKRRKNQQGKRKLPK